MSDPIINVRIPAEWLVQVDDICERNNISRTEYIRGLIAANLEGMPQGMISLGGFQEGYQQARSLAARLAQAMLVKAQELMPDTYEEALVRYGNGLGLGRRPGRRNS